MKKYKSSTCIVLWKMRNGKLAIAGDRRCTISDTNYMTMNFRKINKQNNILLGASGDSALCEVLINQAGFKIPECKTKNIHNYMFNIFRPALCTFLKYFYNIEKGHSLVLPAETYTEVLIGIEGQGWSCIVSSNISAVTEIYLMPVPSIPCTSGCGGIEALCLLKYIMGKQGHISKNDVKEIFMIVGDVNSGCDSNCDILTQD